jgi:hypothetical protein
MITPNSSVPEPNKLAAPNPAMASQLHVRRHWRGIGEPDRWTKRLRRACDVMGEVEGSGSIPPGGAALRRERWAGRSGSRQRWVAGRALSKGVRSGRRRLGTKTG